MKIYKKMVPYLLLGSAAIFNHNSADAQDVKLPEIKLPRMELQIPNKIFAESTHKLSHKLQYAITQSRLVARAENTRDMYMENMLAAQKRLGPQIGKRSYRTAVRKELPGAPVGAHCMYGQYTQLMRALNENGDTLTIIPTAGKSACSEFKRQMRSKYSKPEYDNAIREGHAFESDSAYNAALKKHLARRGLTEDNEKYGAAIAEFEKHNFSLSDINPGAIMIVPRFRGAKNKFHAIMFLGEGRVDTGEFVPDATGNYMFTAHNRERIGNVVKNWDMSNVFVADIEKILQVEYTKELKRLESMSNDKMIEYIIAGTQISGERLLGLPRVELIRLVHAKYFGDDMQKALSAPVAPMQIAMQNQLQISRS